MEAIYSSKLYKSSKRKDRILAAAADPINLELVQQLRSYVDDEYLEPKQDTVEHDDTVDVHDESSSEVSQESPDIVEPPEDETIPDDSEKDSEPDELTEEKTDEENPAEASILVKQHPVLASDELVSSTENSADMIRGSLNSRSDTCGVSRVKINDEELWIHYNDKTNLNDVMEPVIAYLASAGYINLEFNRLARSSNAIVFDICKISEDNVDEDSDEG